MPPGMITKESSLAEVQVDFSGGLSSTYHMFTSVYNSQDCYFLVHESRLSEFPTTRVSLYRLSDLVVECESRHPFKDRDGGAGASALLSAFEDHMNVHEVHSR